MFGLDVKWGAAITAIFSILIFVSKSGQNNGCSIYDSRGSNDFGRCICDGSF